MNIHIETAALKQKYANDPLAKQCMEDCFKLFSYLSTDVLSLIAKIKSSSAKRQEGDSPTDSTTND